MKVVSLLPSATEMKPCGFSVARTLEERPLVDRLVDGLSARATISDANAFFNRPGPRLVESVEILAACIHPALFPDLAEKHAAVLVR